MKSSWGRTVPRVHFIAFALAAVLFVGARLYGARRWNAETRRLRARLDAARVPVRPRTVDFRELEGLPAPVGRYFRLVLNEGQPMVSGVRVRHTGTFNTGEADERWKPFASDQVVVTQRPGFDWNARVAMMPGLPVRVHDAYVAGEGVLRASVLGLFHGGRHARHGRRRGGRADALLRRGRLVPNRALAQPGRAMGGSG